MRPLIDVEASEYTDEGNTRTFTTSGYPCAAHQARAQRERPYSREDTRRTRTQTAAGLAVSAFPYPASTSSAKTTRTALPYPALPTKPASAPTPPAPAHRYHLDGGGARDRNRCHSRTGYPCAGSRLGDHPRVRTCRTDRGRSTKRRSGTPAICSHPTTAGSVRRVSARNECGLRRSTTPPAFRNSGAMSLLTRFKVRRGGIIG